MTTQEIQSLGDARYRSLVKLIRSNSRDKALEACALLNQRKKRFPSFQWAGAQGVMHGWLTVDAENNFIIRDDAWGSK